MKKLYLMDIHKSCLTTKEIQQFKQEITNQENSPVCEDMSTMELAIIGAKGMELDNFRLVKGQLDV